MADEKAASKPNRRQPPRRCHARQYSGPYRESRRRSGAPARPETLRPPTPAVEEPLPAPDISQPQEKLVSSLFRSLVKFWAMILDEPSWPLRLAPGGIVSSLPSPPADEKTALCLSDNEGNDNKKTTTAGNELPLPGNDKSSSGDVDQQGQVTTPINDQGRNWNELLLARLVLQEELSRLRLWKVAFTDDDLDLLAKAEPEIVQSTLKCLVNVSNALITEFDIPKPDQLNSSRLALEVEENILLEFVKRVEALIKLVPYDDDVMTEGDYSETRGSDTTAGGQTFLKSIAENIDRLNRLSHSLCLVLDDLRA
ncbi:hypothetical protein B0J13DRAFT_81929 [Dactylonectria estremocensis]|uniref:Uncharacterized protein n=1 Tax=Dactylonectria estremocensis TaxID=1079267 RepID=A0A9P9IX31_9HYPO|nr:hypothetical protein B0J13DRAFT_81929 [Dactylonectria estremocensis]